MQKYDRRLNEKEFFFFANLDNMYYLSENKLPMMKNKQTNINVNKYSKVFQFPSFERLLHQTRTCFLNS